MQEDENVDLLMFPSPTDATTRLATGLPEMLEAIQEDVNIHNGENVSPTQLQGKRKRSKVWEDFIEKTPGLATCKYCKRNYSAKGTNGTSSLKRHIEICAERKKQKLDDSGLGKTFEQTEYRKLMAEAICKHAYSFTWVEHEGNRKLHKYLNSDVQPICRITTLKDCVKLHADLKEQIKNVLNGLPGNICFTSDLWTACTMRGYLSVTAHYIDQNWKLHSKLLCFRRCSAPHGGFELSAEVTNVLLDWGVEKKVFALTVDNASNMDKMITYLKQGVLKDLACQGKHFHIRCCAHILNLIVKDGLKVIDKCVSKVRASVHYISGSEARLQKFEDCVKNFEVSFSGGLWLDVVTRWNSTYIMLDRALKYRTVLNFYFAGVDGGSKFILTAAEWAKVEKICNLLEPFYEVTKLFSGSNYPTSNLYFRHIWKIHTALLNAQTCGDSDIAIPAIQMVEKFDKYWSDYVYVLAFGVIFDPRYKWKYVNFALSKLHGKVEGGRMATEIRIEFDELFKHYENLVGVSNIWRERMTAEVPCEFDDMEEFASLDDVSSSEIDIYLSEKTMNVKADLDVLDYWKDNSSRFPALSAMARDVLAIPITSVASESTFSMGGRILTKWRSKLKPDHVEALMTTKNWLTGYNDFIEPGISLSNTNEDAPDFEETLPSY